MMNAQHSAAIKALLRKSEKNLSLAAPPHPGFKQAPPPAGFKQPPPPGGFQGGHVQRQPLQQLQNRAEQKVIKKDDIPMKKIAGGPKEVKQVEVVSVASFFFDLAGNSTKGISATDKNTMLFVVMQGEVTVVLNTSQFVVGRGDSFIVPPHNIYNILNMNAWEAELFVQYKYEGSLLKPENAC